MGPWNLVHWHFSYFQVYIKYGSQRPYFSGPFWPQKSVFICFAKCFHWMYRKRVFCCCFYAHWNYFEQMYRIWAHRGHVLGPFSIWIGPKLGHFFVYFHLVSTGFTWNSFYFNTLRQNSRHFADDTLKRIFVNENVRISIKISLKFVPLGPINNIPPLVQIMAWRRQGDKPLSEPMMVSLLTHICVTRPQWVKNHQKLI